MAEIPQLQQKLGERVLERAETDPQWKRQYIEDPDAAMGDMPEAQRLRQIRQMEESAGSTEQPPTEVTMITPTEEYRQLRQSLTEKVLDRAAREPLWKRQLLNDAEAAMREADFPELKRLDEIRDAIRQEEETRGHVDLMSLDAAGGGTFCTKYYPTCYYRGTRC